MPSSTPSKTHFGRPIVVAEHVLREKSNGVAIRRAPESKGRTAQRQRGGGDEGGGEENGRERIQVDWHGDAGR